MSHEDRLRADVAADAAAPLAVLVVEDSPADSRLLQESLRGMLDAGELHLAVVRRLADARVELARRSFDCVLVDLGLPDGRGVGNVEAIAAADPQAAVIVLTGLDSNASALKALRLGAQDYLVKGQYDPVQLLKRIRLAVQRHRQVQALEARSRSDSHQASHDPLTGLPNRQSFERAAETLLQHAHAASRPFSLCFFDLDGFKAINDRHGHVFGDAVLRKIGRTLAHCARDGETVARIGGDEFAILLAAGDDGRFDDEAAAARFCASVRALDLLDGRSITLACSIGIARFPEHGDDVPMLVRASDEAMYAAKRGGGGVRVHSPSAAPAVAVRAPAGADLPITLAFQPWIDTATGRDAGIEVLARRDEAGTMLDAAAFLPEAERSGTIIGIGQTVIRQACTQWATLRDAGLDVGGFAVNVSAAELLAPEFTPMLLGELRAATLDTELLRIEVRGATLTLPTAANVLRRLREAGCRIVLDRFGEDGADLGVLTALPLDGVKIDQRLLRQLAVEGTDGAGGRLLTALLGAAAWLRIPAVVVGVESEDDMHRLAQAGCRYQQGRWHAPALSAAALADRLGQTAPRRGADA